jgi:hypothetical protein
MTEIAYINSLLQTYKVELSDESPLNVFTLGQSVTDIDLLITLT